MKSYALTILLSVMALPACSVADSARIHCEGQEQNRDTYLAMHKILFMNRDGSRVAEFYSDDLISHNQDEGGGHQERVSNADMATMWEESKKRSPDRELINNLILCVGDFVVARVTMKGTRLGLPDAPEGRYFETSAIDIYRFEDGKVVERWGNNDGVTIMRQLGLLNLASE